MTIEEIRAALSVSEEHPVYKAIMHLLHEMQEDETENAIAPDLTSEARHYNAGRVACVQNMIHIIKQTRADSFRK